MDTQLYDDLLQYKLKGIYKSGITRAAKTEIRRKCSKYNVKGGALYYRKGPGIELKVVRGAEEANAIFIHFHEFPSAIGAHSGQKRTRAAISKRFYWPGMSYNIDRRVAECTACHLTQRVIQDEIQYTPIKPIFLRDIGCQTEEPTNTKREDEQKPLDSYETSSLVDSEVMLARPTPIKRPRCEVSTYPSFRTDIADGTIACKRSRSQQYPGEGKAQERQSDDAMTRRVRTQQQTIKKLRRKLGHLSSTIVELKAKDMITTDCVRILLGLLQLPIPSGPVDPCESEEEEDDGDDD